MNNFIIIILIILLIFIFSADKFIIDKLLSNKMVLFVGFIYLAYNNINLVFLLLSFIALILSNENIRNIIINKYQDNIKQLKKYIFNFLNSIYKEGNSQNAIEQLNQFLENEENTIINPDNLIDVNINYNKEDLNTNQTQKIQGRNAGENIEENIEKDNTETDEIQKMLNEIKI